MENQRIIQVEDKVPFKLLLPLSIQHMFAMFGASVLVPFIFGINPAIVLFMNGVGTLIFIAVTKGQAPAYLGSSFAFLAPAGIVIAEMGYEYALGGFVAVGFCGCVLSFIIYKCGTDWIDIVLPPAAMGPVVALIGLELSGSAASNAGLLDETIDMKNVIVFAVTLGVAVFGNILFRGFLSVIPILIAVIAGYIAALACGILDFSQVAEAAWFAVPNFQTPKFDLGAIMMILPVLLVITSEHIGHQVVTSKIVGRDLLKKPGLHRSLFGDNFSTMLSGLIGSVPTTTYGENIGVMAVTKVYSVRVIGGAAVLSIICSFVGKLAMLIQTIPGPVIGGISFLLYGMIGASGIRILVDSQVDYGRSRNLMLTSIVFVTGLSGIKVNFGNIQLTGMVLACVVAMILSLIFYVLDKLNLEVKDGEFCVFLGPSGCGKSTAMHCIAGLLHPVHGEIRFGDDVMTRVSEGSRDKTFVPPQERNIAMVFQEYALYPNMTVRENMSFALKTKKAPKEEINKRVDYMAKMLSIEQLLDRRPAELSGGQRQRVALGRALVRAPQVFLLDEPLGNLDAKLRDQVRYELKKIQLQLGITTIYVTHDQTEAMTMADHIVLLKDGKIMQQGTPDELYGHPANEFVAGFLGTPDRKSVV